MENSDAPVQTIGVPELQAKVEANDVFVIDVRRRATGGQIYGALRYDAAKLAQAAKLALPLPKNDGLIVVYGDSAEAAGEIAERLQASGYGTVALLEGGFEAWQQAGGRVSDETLEQPVPTSSDQQVSR